jgi:antitoxin component of RelBE/YafQ-DinJ toxin-antitoxin module
MTSKPLTERPRKPHFAMSLRLKPTMGQLLETLCARMSLDKTTVVALGLQALAEQKGIPIPTEEELSA